MFKVDQINPRVPGDGFGDALRKARTRMGFTLDALALRVGCAKSYLSLIENGHKGPPSDELILELERALQIPAGELLRCARWDAIPDRVKDDFDAMRARDEQARELVRILSDRSQTGRTLDELHASGELESIIASIEGTGSEDGSASSMLEAKFSEEGVPLEIPIINKVAAGYPASFTDLGYPARIADEYIRSPDIHDPDAFAARVVGDSMFPEYREGDIVIFSPAKPVRSGMDCYVRLEPDHEATFKRVYFERDERDREIIRIQPINNSYPAMTRPREMVAGIYAGVSVTRSIG